MPSAIASCGACKNGWGFSQPDEKEVSCTYEGYTSTMHTKRAYSRFFCPECGDMLSGNPMEVVYSEAHKFDGNGRCVCGYIATLSNTCKHETYGFGYESGGFEKKDASGHNERVLCWYQCWICGYEWREFAWTEYKAHTFDSNGRCSACGYTSSSSGSCKHTNKKSEKVGSVSKQYDDKCHETIVTYRDVCADCNAVLSAERKDTNKFDHRFDANGTCFCGYVQAKRPCDHTPTETLKDTKYGKADINGHEVIKTYHYECECKQVSYDEKKTSVGAHDYNRNTCRLCGFEKECEHPDFENVVSTAVEKNPNSASMHIIVTTYAEKCFCGAANPNPVKRTAEACRFIKNADVQSVHKKQGHQYVDKCECGNEKANGKFKAYVSGCADCKHFYDQCVLSRGNASNIPEKVKELQELLMRSGYDLPYYGADGDFSRETEKAVEKFQKDHGLPVTGVVDEATWNALKNTLNYTDTLSKGNPSNKTHVVKELQELLIKNGYELPYYGADGDFSRETEKAVKKFQKDHGLPETGVVDEATWAMLRNPDGTFETDAPGHGPMEGLTDDNPSHSSAETLPPKADSDDDTEGTPSHAPMEGIDEGEPDHGTMEGIEDDSPSHSLDATLPPKIEDESEVVIDGSFGKASYTAEIGDTLSISVRAGSENANLERVTINVDGSGVDRLASEAISGTAWSGTLPLNCSAYPLNTPGTYTLKLYVSADAGDPNWAIVDYATLVVNDAPVKPDKPVVNVAIDGNTMTATWNAVDGADRYVYSLYNITDDYRIVQHASANKRSASAALEAGKQYRIAVAAVPASVRDTMTETDMCSWTEVVFEMPIAEEADDMIPAVLSVTTNARSRTLLPGDPFTAAVVCNKYTSSLRVSGVENGYISNTYVDEEGRSCFAYTGSFTHNGVYQIRFTAVDPMGVYVENQTYSVVVPVTVCDHTVGEPVLVSEGKAEYANNDQHLIVCTYEKACVCREVVESYPENVLKAHVLSKSCAYDLEHKYGLGHRKYYVCSVCNGDSFSGGDHPGKDDYSEYEEDLGKSGRCAVCQDKYYEKQRIMEAQSLLQGLGYNIGAAGADGVLGTDTLAALNAFRADVMGLGAIGDVDDVTLEALRRMPTDGMLDQKVEQVECSVYKEGHQYKLYLLNAHPHASMKCDCGATTENGGVEKLTCCKCGYHEWSAPQHVGGLSYKEICMKECGTSRSVAAPAQQAAGDKFIQNIIDDRKEMSYVLDSDNIATAPGSDLNNYYIAVLRNGSWTVVDEVSHSNSIELLDLWDRRKEYYSNVYGASDIGITRVDAVGFELAPAIDGAYPVFSYAGDMAFDTIVNIDSSRILQKTDVAQMAKEYEAAYNDWKSTYTGKSSAWLSIAYGATDTLTTENFGDFQYVWTNEFANGFSDPAQLVADAAVELTTDDIWHVQKVDLWEDALSDMLTNNYTPVTSSNDARSTWSNIGTTIGISGLDPKFVKGMQWTAKQAGLSDYIDWGDLGSEAYEKWDWGTCEAIFTLTEAYFAGSEAEAKVKEAQDALAIMVMEDEASIHSLQNIIASTNNPQLIEAAENMIKDIETERDKNFGEFVENIMESIEIGSAGFTAAGGTAVKKAANHYAGSALPGLGVVGNIASGVKLALNWEASYESAQTLMTYSVMEAELNVANTLSNCDTIDATNDMVQLWYSLQINGTETAKQFAKDYNAGRFLYLGDIGLVDLIDENSTVTPVTDLTALMAKLNAEVEEYKNEASEFADYCNK